MNRNTKDLNFNRKKLYSVIKGSLTFGLATAMTSTAGFAQEQGEDESKELDRVLVTGSRIKRVDIETANPVTVITREDIDLSGDTSVAEVLRNMSTNTFGSWRGISGYGAGLPGATEIDIRGVGATLVLIDGRRMAGAGYDGGGTQNLNNIPLAIVERIEVLRGGASAIYGSDAVGGVINVITLNEMDGANASYLRESRDTYDGETDQFEFAAGVNSDRGNMLVTFQHTQYDELPDNNVSGFNNGTSWWGPVTNYFVDAGSSDAFYPEELCEAIPNTVDQGYRCGYAYSNVTWLYPKQERDSIMTKFNWELSDNVMFRTRLSYIGNETQSRFAPTPVSTNTITMSADNPNAPADLPPEATTLFLYHRSALLGTRDAFFNDNTFDGVFGLEGYWNALQGLDWAVNYQYTKKREDMHNTNLINDKLFQEGIDDGTFDIFNSQGLSAEDWAENALDFYKTVGHTGIYEVTNKRHLVDGNLGGELWWTDAMTLSAVAGFEFEKTDFTQISDPQSAAGFISGGSGGDDVFADRDRTAAYAEVGIDLNFGLELTGAIRYDEYDQSGITAVGLNPEISEKVFDDTTWMLTAAWRPVDSLLLRGTAGTAFRAPTMDQLFASRSFGFPAGYDYYYCDTLGNPSGDVAYCDVTDFPQHLTFSGGNPTLEPENADTYSVGVVWQATDDLSIELQYYNIEYENKIVTVSLDDILQFDQASGGTSDAVTRNPDGKIESIQSGLQNFDVQSTDGFDFRVAYGLLTERAGNFNFNLDVSHVLSFDDVSGDQTIDRPDTYGYPETRGNFTTSWTLGDLWASWRMNYISSTSETSDSFVPMDSVVYHNPQIGYNFSWEGALSVGVRNLTEEEVQFRPGSPSWRNYDWTLYHAEGRVWWLRYAQDF